MHSLKCLRYLKEFYLIKPKNLRISLFSPLLCGFRKGYGTQEYGTLLMDLSKAYDCVNHKLVIAKLAADGLKESSLGLIQNYLLRRRQRVKIDSFLSGWLDIVLGVPEGSTLRPILLIIFINDLLHYINEVDVCNLADDRTLYKCGAGLELVSHKFEVDGNIAIHWLKNNDIRNKL